MKKEEGLGSIHIKEKNKGTFTEFCKNKGFGGVTCECIEQGLGSPNAKTRKRANFALQFGRKDCKK